MKRPRLGRTLGIAAGSAIVYRRRAAALAAWVAAGRRSDLTGWRAALGPLARLAALTLAAYVVQAVVRAAPWLMWLLTAAWLRAAWRAARVPAEDTDEPFDDETDGPDVTAVLALLATVLDGRDRVHLSTVLTHLQEQGHGAGWKVSDLRARLEALGVPVALKVKVAGVPTRGIVRADLDARFPGWDTPAPPAAGDAA